MTKVPLHLVPALVPALALAIGPGCQKRVKLFPKEGPAVVVVHSTGVEPRIRLRYRFQPAETLKYRMKSHRRISGLSNPAAPVIITLSVRTDRVWDRRALLRWRVESVTSGSGRLRGLELWVETSDRGEITRVRRGQPPGKGTEQSAPKGTRQPVGKGPRQSAGKGLGQIDRSMRQIFLAWPAQAVGPGAHWTQRRDLILAASTKGGLRTRVVARYRFERIAPCGHGRCAHFSVRITVALSHKAGKVRVQGNGTGTGRVVFDLDRGRVLESHTRAVVDLSTSLLPGKVVQKLILVQSLEMIR
jgi:hypothetical protein